MTKKLYIKRNDRKYWRMQANDSDGIVNLTGATVVCTAKNVETGVLKVNRQACVITDAANGEYEYRPTASDVDTVGEYSVETEVTPASGPKFTLPEKPEDVFIVAIVEDLDAT